MQKFIILETESPTFGGRIFGKVGPYERLTGYAIGVVDPAETRNAGIVNLDKAPRWKYGSRMARSRRYRFVARLRDAVEGMIADGTLLRDEAERIVTAAMAGETIATAA